MDSALTSRRKSVLACLVPVAMISPSLIWIALDKSVWPWDPAYYGGASVELFFSLMYMPTGWICRCSIHSLSCPWSCLVGSIFCVAGIFTRLN